MLNRGDIGLARFPHTAGARGKKRPVVVVQADSYNGRMRHVIVAEVTTNTSMRTDPACLFIKLATAEGQATGLLNDSVVNCLMLASINADRITPLIGKLSGTLLQRLNDCLKQALDLP